MITRDKKQRLHESESEPLAIFAVLARELLQADNDRFSACRQTVPTPGSYHLHRNKWKNVSRDKASRKLRQAITL